MPAGRTYPQARYWLLTIPHAQFVPYLPPGVTYIRGQLERGEGEHIAEHVGLDAGGDELRLANPDGYLHWQLVAVFNRKVRLGKLRELFGPYHAEPTLSKAALAYVWKENTRVEGTQFELGVAAMDRGNANDWEQVRTDARLGNLDAIPGDIYVRNYGNLRRIAQDNLTPVGIVKSVVVYWGPTGTGKSRRAWDEATFEAYPKDPRTKFWDGYRGHKNVVFDEFRGDIDIAHLLRWFDRYPVNVEIKGSSVVLSAEKIWITSNIPPEQWYPLIDPATMQALLRRMEVIEMN